MSTISELGRIIGSGGRASKYRVAFAFPSGVSAITSLADVDVMAKAAIAPQKEIGIIELFNQGRKLPIPGDTVFDGAWSVSFYGTEDHQFRKDIIKWMDSVDSFQTNKHSGNPLAVMTDLRLEQLDSAGEVTAQYTLHNCWPSSVGEISYSDESVDTLIEFDVVFSYSDWVIGTGEVSDYSITKATENETAI